MDPFQFNDLQCHSKFRPPEIEVVEFKARRVWSDWDDFPPYQNQNKVKINEDSNINHLGSNDRAKKRYNMEIKKTQDEIEEMSKRFRLYDYENFEPKNRINTNFQSYEFFNTNQKYTRNIPDNLNTTTSTNSKYYTGSYQITSNKNDLLNNFTHNFDQSHYISSQMNASSNLYNKNQKYNWKSSPKFNNDNDNDKVDYEITSAATLEAGLLREQNEAMKKRITFLKQKLEAQKNENKKVLRKIEESEIDRHQMIDYLNSSKAKK